ncbi:MAG: gliding motility-associated-like protein [Parvicellaceae bacterium]|jgi:gliding motility-associated-like protein
MKRLTYALIVLLPISSFSQYCDSLTPTFQVDLSASPSMTWISPDTNRVGNCCGTGSPDKCIEFELTLHPAAVAIVFDIYSGAVPPGALFYQVDCGPITMVGEPLCVNGAGPHHLTFCKPGNNNNEYYIQSLGEPEFGPDIVINDGCTDTLWVSGLDESTVTWNSIAPGLPGVYNGYLSCSLGCDTVHVLAGPAPPPFVDYEVCGYGSNPCDTSIHCQIIRVTLNSTLAVSISPINPVICYGSSGILIVANPSGGTPPYNYLWNTGAATQNIFVGVGTYNVLLSDGSGCPPTSAIITVTEFTLAIDSDAGIDKDLCASNLPVNLTGTIQSANGGIWSGGSGTFSQPDTSLVNSYFPSASELASGFAELVLTSTGNHGCPESIDSVLINFHEFNASTNLTSQNISCFGFNDGQVDLALTGGNFPHSIQWSNGSTDSTINGLSAGAGLVTITDYYGCDSTLTYTVFEPTQLTLALGMDSILCNGGLTSNTLTTIGGGLPLYQMTINGNSFSVPSLFGSFPIPNLTAGLYTIEIQDSNNCNVSTAFTINEPSPLLLSLNAPDTVCFDASYGATANVTGGVSPYQYNWSSGSAFMNNMDTAYQSGYSFVQVMDLNGCSISDSIFQFVQNLSSDSLNIFSSGDICIGDSVMLSATYSGPTGPLSYLWAPCGCITAGPFYMHPTSSTTYIVSVTDLCLKSVSEQVTIEVHQLPIINLPTELDQGCAPFITHYELDSAKPGYIYQWDLGNGNLFTGDQFSFSFTDPGTYTVNFQVTSAEGCTSNNNGSNYVTIHDSPVAEISANKTTIDMNHPVVKFVSTGPGGISYYWDFDDGTNGINIIESHTFAQEGLYDVWHWVSNAAGCTDSANIEINVEPAVGIYVPNAFTPNGDRVNDLFYVEGSGISEENFTMLIFDRWGELIYESHQLNSGWNGKIYGTDTQVKTDVYVYSIKAKSVLGDHYDLKGHINLLK